MSARQNSTVMLLREKDIYGEMAYYFVRPHSEKKLLLQKMPKGTQYDIKEYATIITSGYGEPPAGVIEHINCNYDTRFAPRASQLENVFPASTISKNSIATYIYSSPENHDHVSGIL